ncbi:hypothetical protein LMG1866_05657 [Achromobacter ruhlandii]|nr:hypothetical protein LMG26696_03375 [Achromobacter pulmonis]CAB3741808.1 hypothetical protein LMG1866_05657 [Achromobacter ruhlandii]
MIHAGGGAGFGHSTAGGGAGGTDVQPLAPSINISPQAIVLNLRIAHPPIGGPLGTPVPFVDFRDVRMAPRQNLAGLPLALGHLVRPCRALLCQLLAVAPALHRPCHNAAHDGRRRVPAPTRDQTGGARQGGHGRTSAAA